jgi:hypothetical protein
VSKRYAAGTTMIPDMIITMWTDTENSEYLKAVKANPHKVALTFKIRASYI